VEHRLSDASQFAEILEIPKERHRAEGDVHLWQSHYWLDPDNGDASREHCQNWPTWTGDARSFSRGSRFAQRLLALNRNGTRK